MPNNFRYMRSIAELRRVWGRYNEAIGRVLAEKDAATQKKLARELALPVRLGEGGSSVEGPKTGTPGDHVIVRPTGEKLLDIRGRSPATPAKNISFENLSLIGSDFCERRYLFPQGKDGSTPEPLQQGMVFGENVERLTIKNCRLLAAGHSAVWLNKHAQNCVVENNLIVGAGFTGVYLNGWTISEGPFKSAAESYVNKGHRIESNFIYDCSKLVGGGGGIQIYQSGDNLVTRSEIGRMSRYGISDKGARWGRIPKTLYGQALTFENHWDFLHTRNNRTIGNDIYSVCRNSCDYGGIESWGPGRDNLWENNAVHDLDQALEWDAWAHILFADDAGHYLTIRNNILYHCHGGAATGALMMKNIGEEIANNLVADCTLGRLVTLAPFIEPGWDFTVRRNVFALDGKTMRYDTSRETFTGMAGTLGSLPAEIKKGIREVDYNVIAVKDPAKPCRIHAVQVNFSEQDTTAAKRRVEDELYHQYTLEVSADGQSWKMLVDKSVNQRDVPHDYIQLEKPVLARHVRLTNIHMAAHGKLAVRDLRVFGSGLGQPPAEVMNPVVKEPTKETAKDAIQAVIEWPAAAGATGYVVRWGHAKDKLYHSRDVRDTKAVISSLTAGLDYYFAVDGFNDSGVTFGKNVVGICPSSD